MFARGHRLTVVVAWVVVMAAGPVGAQGSVAGSASARGSVLVAPVQGSEAARVQHGERVLGAVRRALEVRGFEVTGSQGLLGQAVVACRTPECAEQALDASGAVFAIVPAIWSRESGGEELTLTLVQRSGGNLNASRVVGDDLSGTAVDLVDELLARRVEAGSAAPRELDALHRPRGPRPGERHPHAWKAGPIILIAGGAGAFIAIGVAAGVKSDSQQLNTAAVAAWSVIGAAAIGGGIAWWVVGEKRRRQRAEPTRALAPAIAFRPARIDLRLRF